MFSDVAMLTNRMIDYIYCICSQNGYSLVESRIYSSYIIVIDHADQLVVTTELCCTSYWDHHGLRLFNQSVSAVLHERCATFSRSKVE